MDRILSRIQKYILAKPGLSIHRFEMSLGMSNGTLHNALVKEKASISSSWLEKMVKVYPDVNPHWLVSGEGSMLRLPAKATSRLRKAPAVPFYDVEFEGGFDDMYSDTTVQTKDSISCAEIGEADMWCRIKGHSMEPTICSQDRIALRQLSDPLSQVRYGDIYAIVTNTGLRTVKRIEKGETEETWRLVPDNDEFQPKNIEKATVLHVFKVVAHMGLL